MTMPAPPSVRSRNRQIKSVVALKSAADCIGAIEQGVHIFAITRNQFSMIDIIQHCLREMGPSKLSLWTWCIADYELETFEWLLKTGDITGALLVIDRAGEQQQIGRTGGQNNLADKSERQHQLLTRWSEKFGHGSIRVVLNHAKIATIDNGKMKVVIRGSANLNCNPRFETMDLTESPELFAMIAAEESSMKILPQNYTRRDAEISTGVHSLFSEHELKEFRTQELKTWRKT